MPILKLELFKPAIWVAKGTLVVFNNDASFSSILHRKGMFRKYEIVDGSMSKRTIKKVQSYVQKACNGENHFIRMKLTEMEECKVLYSAEQYILELL